MLLAALHLDDFLDRHQDLAELVLHAGALDAVDQRALHALLEARIRVHDIPFLAHHSPCPISMRTAHSNPASIEPKKQRHHDDEREHDAGRLQRFLARRPHDALGLVDRFLREREKFLARRAGPEHDDRRDRAANDRDHARNQRALIPVVKRRDTRDQ